MAITTESYNADGINKIYTVATTILSQSHCRIDYYYDGLDHEIPSNTWDVINNSIVFKDSPTDGYIVKITISTDGGGLDAAPSANSTVAANIDNVNKVANDSVQINEIYNHRDIIYASGDNADIATTKASESSISATNASTSEANALSSENKAAYWEARADDRAAVANIAKTASRDARDESREARDASTISASASASSATEALLRVWEAEAEKMTADSYANEAEDVFVKIYSSNGDGTFSYTDGDTYSSLHWKIKADKANNYATTLQTVDTDTVYDDASTDTNYKLYIDNGDIVLEEI
jgi:hypothetical protein